MATVSQVQRGFAKFVDNYVAGAYTGIEKAIVLGGGTLISASIPNILNAYTQSPLIAALNIYNQEAGVIDIDALYNAFIPHIGSEKIPVKLPKVGSIDLGTIRLGKEEIDALVHYIREA